MPLSNTTYLQQRWHPQTCPETIELETAINWLGLKVLSTQNGHHADDTGQVEFCRAL